MVLVDPAGGLVHASSDIVHAVGSRKGQLSIVHQRCADFRRHILVFHVDTTTLMRHLAGGNTKGKPVPSTIGDIMRTGGGVDAKEMKAATTIADLDTDVVAVGGSGPVCDVISVDLATKYTDGGRVLLMGSHARNPRGLTTNRRSRDQSGSESRNKRGDKVHICDFCSDFAQFA